MPRLPALTLLAVAVAGLLASPLGLIAAVGLPVVVGCAAASVAPSHAWAHEPEEKSRGGQAPTALTLLVVLTFTCVLLTPLPHLAGPWARVAPPTCWRARWSWPSSATRSDGGSVAFSPAPAGTALGARGGEASSGRRDAAPRSRACAPPSKAIGRRYHGPGAPAGRRSSRHCWGGCRGAGARSGAGCRRCRANGGLAFVGGVPLADRDASGYRGASRGWGSR
jgi:hypothetical protein